MGPRARITTDDGGGIDQAGSRVEATTRIGGQPPNFSKPRAAETASRVGRPDATTDATTDAVAVAVAVVDPSVAGPTIAARLR